MTVGSRILLTLVGPGRLATDTDVALPQNPHLGRPFLDPSLTLISNRVEDD